MRAIRKGILSFGLVSIPVQFYVGARSLTVSFNQLHAACKSRIRYKLYCPTCERDVDRSEIVKGYQSNGHVVMEDADFEKVEQAASRAIDVLEFVKVAEVDPIYFETSYYLGPQRESERAYAVLLEGLRQSGKAAVVRFVMGTRQHHALVRAGGDSLVLHTLHYADEVRTLDGDWKLPKPAPAEVELAARFIEALSREGFDPETYRDEYREQLTGIIRAKAEGQPVVMPAAPPAPAKVVNLMDALRQSIEQVKKPPAKAEPRAASTAGRRTTAAQRRKRAASGSA
jgi:DNA end-binding protein Ku